MWGKLILLRQIWTQILRIMRNIFDAIGKPIHVYENQDLQVHASLNVPSTHVVILVTKTGLNDIFWIMHVYYAVEVLQLLLLHQMIKDQSLNVSHIQSRQKAMRHLWNYEMLFSVFLPSLSLIYSLHLYVLSTMRIHWILMNFTIKLLVKTNKKDWAHWLNPFALLNCI